MPITRGRTALAALAALALMVGTPEVATGADVPARAPQQAVTSGALASRLPADVAASATTAGTLATRSYFRLGSTTLTRAEKRKLRELVAGIPAGATVTARVQGVVRVEGATPADRARARARAKAVRAQLEALGIARAGITISTSGRTRSTTWRARRVNVTLAWQLTEPVPTPPAPAPTPPAPPAPNPPTSPSPNPPTSPSPNPPDPTPPPAANEAPVVTMSGGSVGFVEGAGPVVVDAGVVVSDVDSVTLSGASVQVSAGFQAGQDVLAVSAGAGISGSFDAAVGVLTLTGAASVADYQSALRSVTYANGSDAPSTAPRTVSVRVTDGAGASSVAATRGVTVAASNDAPVVTASGGSVAFVEGAGPVVVDAGLQVADPDDASLAGALVSISGGWRAGDELVFVNQAGITGSFDAGSGVLTLAGAASVADYQSALRSVRFGHVGSDPGTSRTVEFRASDGSGPGPQATRTVTITEVNSPPVAVADTFTAVGNTALFVGTARPDGAAGAAVTGSVLANDTDPDTPAGSLLVEAGTFPTSLGGSITIQPDGTFTYQPRPGDTGVTDTFTYRVCDAAPCSSGSASSRQGLLSLPISGQVWYVRNDAAAGGTGTSYAPFDTLAEAESASSTGDTAYIFRGDGTSANLGTGYVMEAGERLIGEAAGLTLDPDGDGSLPAVVLHGMGRRPTLAATGEDVVVLASNSRVAGIAVDPAGSGGGISGGIGVGNVALADVVVADSGTSGAQPGLELDGTTGTNVISDLSVATSGATGVRLNNAGTVAFAATGTISIVTSGAKGLDAAGTDLGASTFDSITVTGSGSGGVRLASTTGSTTFGNLSLTTTSGPTAAFALSSAGTVTVPSSGTANVSATGGPAVDVTGTAGASLALDSVSSTNSTGAGVSIAGLGAGTFSATGGTIAGAAGAAFDLDGGSGTVAYAGALNDGSGLSAEVTGRTGGTVTLSGPIADGSDAGGGIRLSGNTGGSTTFSGTSKAISSGASDAVVMAASDGHTLALTGGGLVIAATSGKGLEAATSGTLEVSGTGNTIGTTTGRALAITATDIAAADVTFQRISSNGAPSGILLDTTGSAGSLVITGSGGTCTAADTSGCSGGQIQNGAGADDSSQTPVGTGIVLRNTAEPSLTRVWLHDHTNYAIRGTGVAGFLLANSVVNGTNGTNSAAPYLEGGLVFDNLTGSASVSASAISGGFGNGIRVANTSGVLNRLTVSSSAFGGATGTGNDAIGLSSSGTATFHATVDSSTFTRAAGRHIAFGHAGTGTGDLIVTGSSFANTHPGVVAGGGGLVLSNSGTSGATTMTLRNNSFRDSVGSAVMVEKGEGASNQSGAFDNNRIGVADVPNSGSTTDAGLALGTLGQGTSTWSITNNQIRGYNTNGIRVVAGNSGASPAGGALNATITGNTITDPGNAVTPASPKRGLWLEAGAQANDSFAVCAAISGNALSNGGSLAPPGVDVRLRQLFSTTVRLPGYVGAATNQTAVETFVAGNNPGGTEVDATASGLGGGFVGGGATCP